MGGHQFNGNLGGSIGGSITEKLLNKHKNLATGLDDDALDETALLNDGSGSGNLVTITDVDSQIEQFSLDGNSNSNLRRGPSNGKFSQSSLNNNSNSKTSGSGKKNFTLKNFTLRNFLANGPLRPIEEERSSPSMRSERSTQAVSTVANSVRGSLSAAKRKLSANFSLTKDNRDNSSKIAKDSLLNEPRSEISNITNVSVNAPKSEISNLSSMLMKDEAVATIENTGTTTAAMETEYPEAADTVIQSESAAVGDHVEE